MESFFPLSNSNDIPTLCHSRGWGARGGWLGRGGYGKSGAVGWLEERCRIISIE